MQQSDDVYICLSSVARSSWLALSLLSRDETARHRVLVVAPRARHKDVNKTRKGADSCVMSAVEAEIVGFVLENRNSILVKG
jgi:hypothetical protein